MVITMSKGQQLGEVAYMHLLTAKRVSPDPAKVKAIAKDQIMQTFARIIQ